MKYSILIAITLLFLGCGSDSDTQNNLDTQNNSSSEQTCTLNKIVDDTNFVDTYPADIPWSGSSDSVEDIQRVFNNARAHDSTISKELVLPSQETWDSMSIQQRGLFILNNERYYRGIKPYEGISNNVVSVAQAYSKTLYDNGVFTHNFDGTNPWQRLQSDTVINNNYDFFKYAENLYVQGSSASYATNSIARAIYGFIYDDDAPTGGSFGHRKFCLATGLVDNSGEDGVEGLVGFGVTKGENYSLYPGYKSTIVVMNAFDPSDSWNHSSTIKVDFCVVKDTNISQ